MLFCMVPPPFMCLSCECTGIYLLFLIFFKDSIRSMDVIFNHVYPCLRDIDGACFLVCFALELHAHVSILYMPPSVQVLAFLGYIPRGGTAGSQTLFNRCCQIVFCKSYASLLPWPFTEGMTKILDLMLLLVFPHRAHHREVQGSRGCGVTGWRRNPLVG